MLKILYINIVLSSVLLANGIHQLTFGENLDDDPSWNTEGTKVVFQRVVTSSGYVDIFTKDIQNSNPATRITYDIYTDYGPCWSPDGSKIAFSSTRNNVWGTWIRDIQTLDETYFCDGVYPRWSLTGNFMVFSRGSGFSWNIWKKDISTGIETQLTFETGQNGRPDLSNDGLKIVFEHGQSNPSIWIVSSNGGFITQLPVYGYRPRWSPNGDMICFDAGALLTGIYIYIYNLTSGQLTNTNVEGMHPDWSVQGDKIVFVDQHSGHLFYMDYPFVQELSTLGKIKAMYK